MRVLQKGQGKVAEALEQDYTYSEDRRALLSEPIRKQVPYQPLARLLRTRPVFGEHSSHFDLFWSGSIAKFLAGSVRELCAPASCVVAKALPAA